MHHRHNFRRAAVAAVAVGSLFSLAACGSDPQPADGATDSGSDGDSGASKTIVFSPLGLQIPAMKQLSEGVQAYGKEKGYDVTVQDPKLDPQKQVTDLQASIESGSVAGAWTIAVAPPAMSALVQTALDKGVPMILNGVPEDYGLDGLQPGVSFSTIDYEAEGEAAGTELGNCINERYDGKSEVLFAESSPGTAGKEEFEGAVKKALAATAPDAKIVTTITVSDRTAAQTDVGNALQGNPDVTAVFAQNDEGALGTIGAYKAAGKDIPCITEGGGNEETLAAVKSGDIYAVVALQFQADMAQSFDALTAMIDDPEAEGVQLTVPQEVVKAEG
ncbi:ABC-type sugar transport system substrate-binding protein [Nocardioides sp. BE266]|uniref:sugar ABC transporter substrate-binding protein n=1 Tax=Nocardioides sp. BE266 TaxID=2817725 RepID=UPI0028586DAB|nr:sugar ABC transporter substrate-binding protein [Nocardioides sp. BE266]MDR7255121.1 ABC-type sugar transport system substrate-binding protein [Nocardioides sp. BE266]